ncbi:MAG TPA: hypothetical protein VHF25_00170 [Nitriliruptorales bacterium]|nr:hypothetical protein [Nitriliruptorales bacterium]
MVTLAQFLASVALLAVAAAALTTLLRHQAPGAGLTLALGVMVAATIRPGYGDAAVIGLVLFGALATTRLAMLRRARQGAPRRVRTITREASPRPLRCGASEPREH